MRSEFFSGHRNTVPPEVLLAFQLTLEEEIEDVAELYLKRMGSRDRQNRLDIYDKWIHYPVRPTCICRLSWLEDLYVCVLDTSVFSRLDWKFLEAKKWTLIIVCMVHLKLLQVIRCIRHLYSKETYLFPKLDSWLIYMIGKCQKIFEMKV